MNTIEWYILKLVLGSGAFTGYYFLFLRNKIFHKWNRFYILLSILLSAVLPLIQINIFENKQNQGGVISILKNFNSQSDFLINAGNTNHLDINAETGVTFLYCLISFILLALVIASLVKIEMWRKKFPLTILHDVEFLETDLNNAPFSFMKSIFWSNKIDLQSHKGKQIFQHELTHVRGLHSYDKLFTNTVLAFGWFNPFFWILKKELNMIHEFLADKSALEDSDLSAYSEAILETLYPGRDFLISNSFFYSPLKRRIIMLAKNNQSPKSKYFGRVIAIPLMFVVACAFTLHVKSEAKKITNLISAKQDTTVVPPPPPPPPPPKRPKKSDGKVRFVPPLIVKDKVAPPPPPQPPHVMIDQLPSNKLYILDGVESNKEAVSKIGSSSIMSVDVVKDKNATDRFGEKGKNGVIIVTTKKSSNGMVFTQSEIEPQFPGGDKAWANYISNQIKANGNNLSKSDEGTCVVKFIVEADGSVSNATALTMTGTKLSEVALKAIKDGPRWVPAKQNNYEVRAYKSQPISFKLSN